MVKEIKYKTILLFLVTFCNYLSSQSPEGILNKLFSDSISIKSSNYLLYNDTFEDSKNYYIENDKYNGIYITYLNSNENYSLYLMSSEKLNKNSIFSSNDYYSIKLLIYIKEKNRFLLLTNSQLRKNIVNFKVIDDYLLFFLEKNNLDNIDYIIELDSKLKPNFGIYVYRIENDTSRSMKYAFMVKYKIKRRYLYEIQYYPKNTSKESLNKINLSNFSFYEYIQHIEENKNYIRKKIKCNKINCVECYFCFTIFKYLIFPYDSFSPLKLRSK
ncbi:MAG: hypothetical protein H6604_02580 [Flavobacteriales bacterium]|nr:hypothetical protein [Flavobacteriales bacterium]